MFRVRVDNGLTQRNAEERGEGEGEKGEWVVIRGLVGRAKRRRREEGGEDGKHAVCKLCKR